jgi:plasmid stabilization system protein ParE
MAKRKIIWSPRANFDLLAILDFYYKRNGSKTYSRQLNSALRKAIKLLSQHAEIGVHTDIEDVRNLIHGDFNIFYEITPKAITILTIWDSRQDPDRLRITE